MRAIYKMGATRWKALPVWLIVSTLTALGQPVWAQRSMPTDAATVLRFEDVSQLPAQRKITLSLNKAMLVELPVDDQDVIVSHPETVDATVLTARRVMLIAKAAGQSNIFFMGKNGRKLLVLDLVVRRDISELSDMLKTLIAGSHIKVTASGDGLVLSGRVVRAADAGRAEDIAKEFAKKGGVVNLITVAEKEQVLLKVTVAEIQREAIKRLGVNLPEALAKTGAFTFTKVIQNGFPISSGVATAAGFVGAGQVPAVSNGSALQAVGSSRVDLQACKLEYSIVSPK